MSFSTLYHKFRRQNCNFFLLWLVKFLYRFGFVTGWTLIVTVFLTQYHVFSLPYLLVGNALFIMFGGAVYSFVLARFKKSVSLIGTVIATGAVLFLAVAFSGTTYLFLLLLLFAEAFLMYQLNLVLEGFIESIYTYVESEKKVSMLETADTIGGLCAGAVIFTFAEYIATPKFVYLWIISLFLMIPVFLSFVKLRVEFFLPTPTHKQHVDQLTERLAKVFAQISQYNFYKILIALVFLYWLAINLVEYQFTSAVYNSVSSLPYEGSGLEHALAHELSSLNMIFYLSIFVVQFLISGRIISKLGVIGGMLIYPLVMLLSVFALFFNFNFVTSVLAKNNLLVSGVVFKNSYFSSYYVMKERMRLSMREVLEGFVHPLGAMLATAFLIFIQNSPWKGFVPFHVNYLLLMIFGLTLFLVFKLRREYLRIAMFEFKTSKDNQEKIAATEIISQEGMKHGVRYLIEQLGRDEVPPIVKIRIIQLLKDKSYRQYVLPILIQLLEGDKTQFKEDVLLLLNSFVFEGKKSKSASFSYYRLKTLLKKMFLFETDLKSQKLMLGILSKFSNFDAVEFLLSVVKKSRVPEVVSGAISLCRGFDDVALLHYFKTYAKHKNPLIRFQVILLAWDFPDSPNDKLNASISSALTGKSNTLKLNALKALLLSNPKASAHFEVALTSLLNSSNQTVQFCAALCLGRTNYEPSLNILVGTVLFGGKELSMLLKENLDTLPIKFRNLLVKTLNAQIKSALLNISDVAKVSKKNVIDDSVAKLRELFDVVDEYEQGRDILDMVEENLKHNYSKC